MEKKNLGMHTIITATNKALLYEVHPKFPFG
jgi:hypothetical protein